MRSRRREIKSVLSGSVAVCLLFGLCTATSTALAGSQQLPEFNLLASPGVPVTPTSSGGAFEMNMSTGDFSGTFISGGIDFAEQGNENGNVATYTLTEEGGASYVATDIQHLGILPNGDIGGPSSFTDTNGNSESYTADYNNSAGTTASRTSVSCAAAGASYLCTATVTGLGGTPTGNATFSASSGTIVGSPACALTSGSCSVTYSPPSGGIPAGTAPPVGAVYSADSTFRASQGTASPPVMITALAPKTTDTFLEGYSDALFTITLSRAASEPVTVDYATADGSGPDGLKAADGDYEKTTGTLTFAPGVTSETVNVKVYADIDVRVDGDFDLVLSAPTGADFAASAAAADDRVAIHRLNPHEVPDTTLTVANKVHVHADITVRVDGGFDLLLSDLKGAAFPDAATGNVLARERPAASTAPKKQLKVPEKVRPDLVAGYLASIKYSAGFDSRSTPVYLHRYLLAKLVNFSSSPYRSRVTVGSSFEIFEARKGVRMIHRALMSLNGKVDSSGSAGVKVTTRYTKKIVNGKTYDEVNHQIRMSETGRSGKTGWVQIDLVDGILKVES